MPPMRPPSRLRPPPRVRRVLRTRRWPPRRLRSPAATPPTRRSTGCSVAPSRSKASVFITKTNLARKNAAHRAAFFLPGAGMIRLALLLLCATSATAAEPQNFLFVGSELAEHTRLLERPDIAGAQVVYSWKALESAEGQYDFSAIETDLGLTERTHKKLFLQIQDRFFEPQHRNIPRYLLEDPQYGGGLAPQRDNPGENQPEGSGWVSVQWNAAVRTRFQALLTALAGKFDGRVYGINLPESAADIDEAKDSTGFTCDGYFAAELENIRHARRVFRRSHVVQYVNFWPCGWNDEHGYFTRFFEIAAR